MGFAEAISLLGLDWLGPLSCAIDWFGFLPGH